MARVQHHVFLTFQKCHRQRNAVCDIAQFLRFDLINGKEFHPFLALGRIGGDFRIKIFRDAIQREAIVRSNDKFLFQPELFLKVFQLLQKRNNFMGDFPDHLNQA